MTDTMSSTPQPEPSSDPARPQRFRLPEPEEPTGASSQAVRSRPALRPAPSGTATKPNGPRAGGPGPDGAPRPKAAPDGRYGEKRGMSTPRKIGLVVIGLMLLGGVVGYIGWQQANPTIQGTVTKFDASKDSVIVTFEVDKPANRSATCTLVAEDVRGTAIGTASVPIVAGREKNVESYTLQTTSTANTVIVQSCSLTS